MKIPRSLLLGGNFETSDDILLAWVAQCPDIDPVKASEVIAGAVWATQKLLSKTIFLAKSPVDEDLKEDVRQLRTYLHDLIDFEENKS